LIPETRFFIWVQAIFDYSMGFLISSKGFFDSKHTWNENLEIFA
jgi:hypothetical protein